MNWLVNKKILPVAVLLGASLVASVLLAWEPEVSLKPPSALLPAVRVIAVSMQTKTLTVASEGVLKPSTESTLVPEVDGRILWLAESLVIGGHFDKGDELLRIDPADYQAAADEAQAILTQAAVEEEFARDEFERNKKLYRQKLVSQTKYDDSKRHLSLRSAEKQRAKIALGRSQRDLKRTVISAPYTGRVRTESVAAGQFVRRGEVIAELYANDRFEVRLPVARDQLRYLNLPQSTQQFIKPTPVRFSAGYGSRGHSWQGELVRGEAEVDARSRMFYGIAEIESEKVSRPLLMGMFVQAQIEGVVVEGVVSLPRVAVRDDQHVLVVDAEDRLRVRAVEVLRSEQDQVLIASGLKAGERVCISPLDVVVDGMRVKPVFLQGTGPLEHFEPEALASETSVSFARPQE